MKTDYLDDRVVSNPPPCRQDFVKLTKKSLNYFIRWTTSRYNDYLGFGTKKEAVETIYESFGYGFRTQIRFKRFRERYISGTYINEYLFIIECASPVGESGRNTRGSYWRTKTAGDVYIIDCKNRTINALYSKRSIKFI